MTRSLEIHIYKVEFMEKEKLLTVSFENVKQSKKKKKSHKCTPQSSPENNWLNWHIQNIQNRKKKKGNRKKQTITLNNEDAPTGLRGSVRDTSGGRKRRSAALPYLGVDRVSRRQRLLWGRSELAAGHNQVADSNANHMSSSPGGSQARTRAASRAFCWLHVAAAEPRRPPLYGGVFG